MGQAKARERREARVAAETEREKQENAGMIAIVAAILMANPGYPMAMPGAVTDARKLIAESFESEGLPSPLTERSEVTNV